MIAYALRHWRTSLAGILAGGAFVIPVVQHWLASGSGNWRDLVKGLALAALGLVASDGKSSDAP